MVKGADIFVAGASDIAKFLKIPSVIVGLTIVSLGTSAPEAVVSIIAGINGSNGIALGNVVGSNIFNTMMVVGVCALVLPINVLGEILKRDYPIMIFITLILIGFMFDGLISKSDGFILFVLCILYIAFLIKSVYKDKNNEQKLDDQEVIIVDKKSIFKAAVETVIGACLIIWGGNIVVSSATNIATALEIPDSIIGLTVIAIGTSLPELVTSIIAAKKGESDIAIGNVVGSNIFNIVFVLGISSSFTAIGVENENFIDIFVFLAAAMFIYIACYKTRKIGRAIALTLVVAYFSYTAYLISLV